ncbi:MAG: endolytic transglycosylase MltG [Candidatus Ancillula sp.]|jgi:UPF0755 protein|nr:endolytic transglycosylase MltG [Candidatus Ancillula sp.]
MKVFGRVVFILVLVSMLAAGGFLVYTKVTAVKDYAEGTYSKDDSVVVHIEAGSIVAEVAEQFEEEGIIMSAKVFIQVSKENPQDKIPTGDFLMYKKMSSFEALERLQDPKAVAVKSVTIPEGKTVKQTLTILSNALGLGEDELRTAMLGLSDMLPVGVSSFEGWLFPDTYKFKYNESNAQNVIKTLVETTKKVLTDNSIEPERYQEVLTKASIVQKEVISNADMAKAARVIDNRLEIDMPLAMDTIVSYGVHDGSGESKLELYQKDLDDPDNPYNSRIHKGLPPTPISNPGEAAIQAVKNPTPGDWLYFITVDPSTGETLFLDTEADFNAAKADYKAWCANNQSVCLS